MGMNSFRGSSFNGGRGSFRGGMVDHEDIIEMQTNILLLFQVHPSEEVTMEDTGVVWEVLEWTVVVAVIEDQPAL